MLSGDPAVYPPLARQHGIEGTVELSALVDENGRVAEVSIVRARPRNVGFESAAVAAVRSRRYRAGTREGVPVRVWIPIVVNFKGRR
jgi:TonB family protein